MSDYIPNARNLNWIIGFGCVFLMGAALYMEHMMHLEPCPLCIFQRVAVIAAGLVAIAAALHNPAQLGIKVYGLLVVLASTVGGALATRQIYLQSLPEDQVPACGRVDRLICQRGCLHICTFINDMLYHPRRAVRPLRRKAQARFQPGVRFSGCSHEAYRH